MRQLLKNTKRFFFPVKRGYFGDYRFWESGLRDSFGSESADMATRRIGFDTPVSNPDLLREIKDVADLLKGMLRVVDFGGGLADKFYQFIKMYPDTAVHWTIVELPKMIDEAKRLGLPYQSNNHKLVYKESMNGLVGDLFLESAAIQCIEKPYDFLESLMPSIFPYLILDRVPLYKRDRLTLRKTETFAYPFWLFELERFRGALSSRYDVAHETSIDKGYLNVLNPDDIFFDKMIVYHLK